MRAWISPDVCEKLNSPVGFQWRSSFESTCNWLNRVDTMENMLVCVCVCVLDIRRMAVTILSHKYLKCKRWRQHEIENFWFKQMVQETLREKTEVVWIYSIGIMGSSWHIVAHAFEYVFRIPDLGVATRTCSFFQLAGHTISCDKYHVRQHAMVGR